MSYKKAKKLFPLALALAFAPALFNNNVHANENGDSTVIAETQNDVQYGWSQEEGSWRYYYDDGTYATGICYLEDNDGYDYSYYYFGENGLMETGWIYTDGSVYYFYPDGKGAKGGVNVIDGISYYFYWDASLATNDSYDYNTFQDEKNLYLVNGDGVVVDSTKKLANQWVKFNAQWYYFDENLEPYERNHVINGTEYYFHWDGSLATNPYGESYVYDDFYTLFLVNSDGVVVEKAEKAPYTWIWFNEDWYYFDEELYPYEGFKTIDGALYFFYDDGTAARGLVYDHDENGDPIALYYFGDNCKMVTGDVFVHDNWYYFSADGKGYTGVHNGYYYNMGEGVQNELVVEGNKYYKTGSYGKIISSGTFTEGWNLVDGEYYYIENGQFVVEETRTINGKKYYFNYRGVMVKGVVYTDDDLLHGFNNDGSMATGWFRDFTNGNEWYYFDENGDPVTGWFGEYYIEHGLMVRGVYIIDDVYYYFDELGICKGKVAEGWNLLCGEYYYMKNGSMLTGWNKLSDTWYYFNDWGTMAYGEYSIYNEETQNYVNYYFKKSGAWVSTLGWIKDEYGDYLYVKENGVLACDEWLKVNGTWYYFSDTVMVTGNHMIEGELYKFASNGAYIGWSDTTTLNGWLKSSYGRYVYYKNGVQQYGWVKDSGTWYYLPFYMATGIYYVDEDDDYYLFADNGAWISSPGWHKVDGNWAYVNADGTLQADAWFKESGKWYYFDGPFMANDCLLELNGQYEKINTSGIWEGTATVKDGWYKYGTHWYYFEHQKMLKGQWLPGTEYYFNYNGEMVNTVTFLNEGFAFDANGHLIKEQWVYNNGYWYYADKTGRLYRNGFYYINGVCYEFNFYGEMIG